MRALYNATNGPTWICNRGWDKILEDDKSTPYGVTMENGHVTKISLGVNNLTGALSFLQEFNDLREIVFSWPAL